MLQEGDMKRAVMCALAFGLATMLGTTARAVAADDHEAGATDPCLGTVDKADLE
jgi:hypothetical protein